MTDLGQTGLEPRPSAAGSIFNGAAFPIDAYLESFVAPGRPRAHWQPIIDALNALTPDSINKRRDRVLRMRREDGATFNLFDDVSGAAEPFAPEMIPLILTAAEWAAIEAGVIQRARLLEQILEDVYGAQRLLLERRIPAELIFANRHFLRPCHGIRPAGGRYLTFYALDLYRAPDGRFRVWRDYGSSPAGLGYALENRIVISRVFSNLYHGAQIHRLAPFFQAFHRGLAQRAGYRREDPEAVILSPGPDSPLYFEQALLSRYLGYPLVEGQDLTIRNGDVFLKKLAGLEPVDAILRHIDDLDIDPFALRKTAGAGVAGLIQAVREGNVDVVNPIGAGFIDTPLLGVFLPALCRALTGTDLLLESHPARWCGGDEDRASILSDMDRWTVGPAWERSLALNNGEDPATAVAAAPYAFMAREAIQPSMVPVWDAGRIRHRFHLLRVFACAVEDGYEVMPGGLALTASDAQILTDDNPARQQSKDVWVLSDRSIEPISFMSRLQMTAEFRRGSDLPSRVADHLLWLGRYLERAEGLVRLLRSVFRRLSGEAGLGDMPEWPFLLDLLRAKEIIPEVLENESDPPRLRDVTMRLNSSLFEKDRPGSLVGILNRVRDSARNVRDRLSVDSWRAVSRLEDFSESDSSDPLELLDDVLFTLSAFSGLAMESMTRGLGWRFMDMGRRVERALNQTSLIRMALPRIYDESRTDLEALLEVSDSIMTYRARYRTTFQLASVLDLLLVDESNPKSLAFQCSQLSDHVDGLPRSDERRFSAAEERLALEMLTSVRLLDLAGLNREGENEAQHQLGDFLESMENRLVDFSQQIGAHYLSRIPATPHYSRISENGTP